MSIALGEEDVRIGSQQPGHGQCEAALHSSETAVSRRFASARTGQDIGRRPVIGLRPDVAIAALILLPATGVAIWAWTTLTRLEQDLRALGGFEGKHFEIGHPTTRSAERSESPIPQSGNSSTPRARMLRWISLEPP